jgi:NAD(P)H-dependent nitrite reductase small subunit
MNTSVGVGTAALEAGFWQDICAESDVVEGMGVAARLGGSQIALFRIGATVHITGNFDPFSGANVIARGIVGDVGGIPVVASPVYKQHFRLHDGVCLENPEVTLPIWSARCIAGRIEVLNLSVNEPS